MVGGQVNPIIIIINDNNNNNNNNRNNNCLLLLFIRIFITETRSLKNVAREKWGTH